MVDASSSLAFGGRLGRWFNGPPGPISHRNCGISSSSVRPDGRNPDLFGATSPVRNYGGRCRGGVSIFAESSEERLDSILISLSASESATCLRLLAWSDLAMARQEVEATPLYRCCSGASFMALNPPTDYWIGLELAYALRSSSANLLLLSPNHLECVCEHVH